MQFLSIISAIASLFLQGSVCATVVEEVVGQVAATIEESGSLNHARIPTAVSDVLEPPVAHAIPLGRTPLIQSDFNSAAHLSEVEKAPALVESELIAALESDLKASSASIVRALKKKLWIAYDLLEESFDDHVLAQSLELGAATDQSLGRALDKVRPRIEASYAAQGLYIVEHHPDLLASISTRRILLAALEYDPQVTAATLAAALEKKPGMVYALVEASFKDQALAKSLERAAAMDQSLARALDKVRPQVEANFAAKGLFIVERKPMLLASIERDETLRRMLVAALDHDPKATAASLAAAIEKNPGIAYELVEASFTDQALALSLERGAAADQSFARVHEKVQRRMRASYAAQGLSLVQNDPDQLLTIEYSQLIRGVFVAALELDPQATAASLTAVLLKRPVIADRLVRASKVDHSLEQALQRDPALAEVLKEVQKKSAFSSSLEGREKYLLPQLEQDQTLRRNLVADLEHDPRATAAFLVRALETKPWTAEILVRASLIDQALARALERDQALARTIENVRPQVEADFAAEGLFIVERKPNLLASLELDQTLRRMIVTALDHDVEVTAASLARAITSEGQWIADYLVRASSKDQALAGALERGAVADQSLAGALEKVRPRVEAEAAYNARGDVEKGTWLVNVLARAPGVLPVDEELARNLVHGFYGDFEKIEQTLLTALQHDSRATAASLARALERGEPWIERTIILATWNPEIAQALVQASKLDQSLLQAMERVPVLAKTLENARAAEHA